MIVRVNVALNRTAVVDSDWHLENLIRLTLTLKMTTATAHVVVTSATVNNNSPIQDYVHPDDHTQPTYKRLLGSNLSQYNS